MIISCINCLWMRFGRKKCRLSLRIFLVVSSQSNSAANPRAGCYFFLLYFLALLAVAYQLSSTHRWLIYWTIFHGTSEFRIRAAEQQGICFCADEKSHMNYWRCRSASVAVAGFGLVVVVCLMYKRTPKSCLPKVLQNFSIPRSHIELIKLSRIILLQNHEIHFNVITAVSADMTEETIVFLFFSKPLRNPQEEGIKNEYYFLLQFYTTSTRIWNSNSLIFSYRALKFASGNN